VKTIDILKGTVRELMLLIFLQPKNSVYEKFRRLIRARELQD